MPFVLTIAEGKGRGQRFQFETESVTIGRGADNDVVLNDAGVSRTHARIQKQGAFWMLLDNGSANGTELNGAALQKPSALKGGDHIGVGPVTFEFSSDREEPALPATGGGRRAQHPTAGTRSSPPPRREPQAPISAPPREA